MAKYLERLVARAGIVNDPSPVVPSPAPVYERQAGDPFENTEVWAAQAPAPQPIVPIIPSPIVAPVVAPAVTNIHTTEVRPELRTEEHWLPAEPAAAVIAPSVETLREIVHEVEFRPATDTFEREIRTESIRAETTVEKETIHTETLRPAPVVEQPAAVERSVLENLMPALDAWFKSDSPAFRAEAEPAPLLAPSRTRDSDAGMTAAATEAPQVVIGSIRVEVSSPSLVAPPSVARRPAARVAPPAPRASRSRLSFGLGQM